MRCGDLGFIERKVIFRNGPWDQVIALLPGPFQESLESLTAEDLEGETAWIALPYVLHNANKEVGVPYVSNQAVLP